jgi:hypothetical protein
VTFRCHLRTKEFDPVIMCCTRAINWLFVHHEPILAGVIIWVLTCHGEVCRGELNFGIMSTPPTPSQCGNASLSIFADRSESVIVPAKTPPSQSSRNATPPSQTSPNESAERLWERHPLRLRENTTLSVSAQVSETSAFLAEDPPSHLWDRPGENTTLSVFTECHTTLSDIPMSQPNVCGNVTL